MSLSLRHLDDNWCFCCQAFNTWPCSQDIAKPVSISLKLFLFFLVKHGISTYHSCLLHFLRVIAHILYNYLISQYQTSFPSYLKGYIPYDLKSNSLDHFNK